MNVGTWREDIYSLARGINNAYRLQGPGSPINSLERSMTRRKLLLPRTKERTNYYNTTVWSSQSPTYSPPSFHPCRRVIPIIFLIMHPRSCLVGHRPLFVCVELLLPKRLKLNHCCQLFSSDIPSGAEGGKSTDILVQWSRATTQALKFHPVCSVNHLKWTYYSRSIGISLWPQSFIVSSGGEGIAVK